MREGEEERIHAAHMNAFADHWDFHEQSFEQWRRWQRDREFFDPTLWFLALDGDEIAGFALCAPHFSGEPAFGWVDLLGVRPEWRRRGLGEALLRHAFRALYVRGFTQDRARRRRREHDGSGAALRAGRDATGPPHGHLGVAYVSRLRARCPDCRTLTAVAIGPEYQCHSCGREFGAGLVRVPRAWGSGGEAMAEAAWLELPYPEAGVVEASSLAEQTLMVASELPDRPLVLGGCCCAHLGAIERLASGDETLAVVWIDAHGDLNTPASSPSGDAWGMPLRTLVDDGSIEAANVALVGARNLDPPEVEFIARAGIHTGADAVEQALADTDSVYVALDGDSVEPGRARRLHAGAGRARLWTSSKPCCARSPVARASPARVSPGSSPIPRTSRSSSGSARRSGSEPVRRCNLGPGEQV